MSLFERWRAADEPQSGRRWLTVPRQWQFLLDRESARRWLVVPVLVVAYVPAFLGLHQVAGSVAYGATGFLSVVVAAAVAGVAPALLVALLIQSINMALYLVSGVSGGQPLASAIIAFSASCLLALAIGLLRSLVNRTVLANRRLDEEVQARRAAEASLDANLQLHSSLVATLGEGVALFDDEKRFILVNAAAESLLGAGRSELLGHAFEEFVEREPNADLVCEGWERGGVPLTYLARLRGDSTRVLQVVETLMVPSATNRAATLRVLRDFTAQSRLERERRDLEQYLQRTEALRSLAVMAGGVAHDFNNLLSGVIGGIELGLLRLSKSPDGARSSLEDAKRFAIEAGNLSRKMLAYAGKRGTPLEPVDLATEAAESLRLVNCTIHGRARLVNAIPTDLPPVLADRTGLHQVITNLVLNGVEAMSQDTRGSLRLEASVCTVSTAAVTGARKHSSPPQGRYVVLSVSDSGTGMSSETQSRLFEPFFSTKFQGRGMGLAATLGIVRAHRGGVEVESKLGVGTTFRVYWPIAERSVSVATMPAACRLVDFSQLTVLLVDDEPAVREVTALMLSELGCRVLVAGGASEALAVFDGAARSVDLVLLDVTMPEKSGFEVLGEMRRIRADVRAVLTSGYGVEAASDPSAHPGVVGFLPKPHSIAAVTAAIRRAMTSSMDHQRQRQDR